MFGWDRTSEAIKEKAGAPGGRLPLRVLSLLLALLLLCGCGEAAAPPAPADMPTAAEGLPETGEAAAPAEEGRVEPELRIDACPVEQGRHQREAEYMATFQTHLLALGPFTLHREDRIYEESLLRRDAGTLQRDLRALEEAVGETPETVTVYLVERTVEDRPQAVGAQVFCTPEDLESGAYREALTGAAYGLPAQWQRVGLAASVFGEASSLSLRDYYADGAHALTASCSAIHLSPLLSDGETVLAARETARSLSAFLLETEGLAAFRAAADPAARLPAWAESLGISPAPLLPEGSAAAAGMSLTARTGYVCALQVKNFTILLTENRFLADPDELYAWLCSLLAGTELMLEQIRDEAPSAAALAEERCAESITICLEDLQSVSITYPGRNEIHLSAAKNTWHELIHLLLEERRVRGGQGWQEEALAEHFCYRAQTRYAPTRYYCEGYEAYLDFFAEVSGKAPEADDLRFHESVWSLYQSFREPDLSDRDDVRAYCRAYGICSLVLDGELERTQVRKLYDLSVNSKRGRRSGEKASDGEALSYPESLVLFEYLAERVGMDEAVEALLDGLSPEEAFGLPYPELYAAARAEYEQRYGDRMAPD